MFAWEYIEIELHREIPILSRTIIIEYSFFMLKVRTLDSMQSFAIVLIITFLAMGSSLWGKWWIFLLDFVLSDGWNFIWGESFGNFIMKLFWWIFGYEIATKSIIFSIHVLSGTWVYSFPKKYEKNSI